MITVTPELIGHLRTPAGGFNQTTMDILGVMWPLKAGWQGRLVGSKIGDRRWTEAVNAAKEGKKHYYRGNTRRHL